MAAVKTQISQSPLYKTIIDQADPNNEYFGVALLGTATSVAKWQIKKLETIAGVLSILWANGSNKADQIWDNRSSLTYS